MLGLFYLKNPGMSSVTADVHCSAVIDGCADVHIGANGKIFPRVTNEVYWLQLIAIRL